MKYIQHVKNIQSADCGSLSFYCHKICTDFIEHSLSETNIYAPSSDTAYPLHNPATPTLFPVLNQITLIHTATLIFFKIYININ